MTGKPTYEELEQRVKRLEQTEEALTESEDKYKEMVNLLPQGIFEFDSQENLTFTNKHLYDLFGYSKNDCENGCDLYQLLIPEDRDRVKENIMRILGGEEFEIAEYTGLRKDRSTFPIITYTNKIIKNNKVAGLRGIIVDVTERMQLEEQLRQSHKMEAIGTLAGGIAHDFNNMLGVIIGNAELAMDDVPEWNPARHNLEEIKTASLRSRDVIKQILSFSKKTNPKQKPVKINPIIKDCLKFLRSTIPTSIEIRKTIPDESGIISADSPQIHQVIMNLCTNAAHAMSENGGIMEVSLSVIDIGKNEVKQNIELNQGQYVKITVSDTGHGISKKHLDRVFDPYFTTKEVGEGSGIGLSVVHGIVKSHDGAISVESNYGNGTTFNVFLPVIEEEPAIEEEIDTTIPTGIERILLVDDEKAIVNLTSKMLERLGYTVTAKTSSTDMLETFRYQPDNFDLIISDMSMPNITGDKLAKELQQIKPDIPIILCTGYSERINEEKAKSIGVRALVMKPIVKSVLAKTIRNVLDKNLGIFPDIS